MAATKKITAKAKVTRPYHKGNVSEDLKAAAAHILQTERFEDISVRRLAREVGVTPGNFYNHFESLDDLLLTLAAEAFRQREKVLLRLLQTTKSPLEAARQSSIAFVEFAISNHQLFRIMFGQIPNATAHEEFHEAAESSFAGLVHLIYGDDIYRPDDIAWSHEHCRDAYALFTFIYGLARNIIEGQIIFPSGTKAEMRRFVEQLIDIMLTSENFALSKRKKA